MSSQEINAPSMSPITYLLTTTCHDDWHIRPNALITSGPILDERIAETFTQSINALITFNNAAYFAKSPNGNHYRVFIQASQVKMLPDNSNIRQIFKGLPGLCAVDHLRKVTEISTWTVDNGEFVTSGPLQDTEANLLLSNIQIFIDRSATHTPTTIKGLSRIQVKTEAVVAHIKEEIRAGGHGLDTRYFFQNHDTKLS